MRFLLATGNPPGGFLHEYMYCNFSYVVSCVGILLGHQFLLNVVFKVNIYGVQWRSHLYSVAY